MAKNVHINYNFVSFYYDITMKSHSGREKMQKTKLTGNQTPNPESPVRSSTELSGHRL